MKNKEANFQILKIAAMLMIVSHHLVAKNAFNIDTQVIGITGNKLALQILESVLKLNTCVQNANVVN